MTLPISRKPKLIILQETGDRISNQAGGTFATGQLTEFPDTGQKRIRLVQSE